MNINKKTVISVVIFMLIAGTVYHFLSESKPDGADEEVAITIEGTTVKYVGKVSDKNAELFMNMVKGKNLTTLVINSGGGEINAGMEIGSWVFDNQIDVVVDGVCMSSCANYVFTAGRFKTIRKGSIVGWHGNALTESATSDQELRRATTEAFNQLPESDQKKLNLEEMIKKAIEQSKEYHASSIKRQAEFFTKIGVDEYVCRIGLEEYGAEDFYILSVADMARFGIQNVQAPENYEQTDLTPLCEKKGKKIEYIKLRDLGGLHDSEESKK
jgi:hypothetical protein